MELYFNEIILLFTFVVLSSIHLANGDCYVYIEGTEGYNVRRDKNGAVTMCEYVDTQKMSHGIPVNTTLDNNVVCERCTCSFTGALDCCGTGHNAGAVFLQAECELKRVDNCNFIIVTTKGALKPCPLATGIQETTLRQSVADTTTVLTTQSERLNSISTTTNESDANGADFLIPSLFVVLLSTLLSLTKIIR